MGTRSDVESCPYAAVCVVSPSGRACVPPSLHAASDLLLAIAHEQLHVFVRRSDRRSSSCACSPSLEGFVCPHVTAYDDAALVLTIPVSSIAQVYMTYRTAPSIVPTGSTATGKGVATRTKDLVLKTTTSLVLWLEFEHNLARGWFLEALSSSSGASSRLEMDYLDLSDAEAVATVTSPPQKPSSLSEFSPRPLPGPSLLAFLRDAWRHVMYDKVKLALQVAHDSPTSSLEDPAVSKLLTTAMELSTRLDEPDVLAFAWLTSGFLHLRSGGSANVTAVAQVLQSLTWARENSLEYLTCLALQCIASVYMEKPETVAKAREYLTEAIKLLTLSSRCAAMEPSLKMQIHATLRGLTSSRQDPQNQRRPSVQRAHSVLSTGPSSLMEKKPREQLAVFRSDSSSRLLDKADKSKSSRAFSLYTHVIGGGSGRSTSPQGDTVKPLLLSRVAKALDQDAHGGSFFVDVLGAHGVHKARFRVYLDLGVTIAWLVDHITIRYNKALVSMDEAESEPVVELLYDPQRKELVPTHIVVSQWIPSSARSSSVLSQSQYTLHAKLAPRIVSSHRTSSMEKLAQKKKQTSKTENDALEEPNVLCSLCGRRIPLSDVEDHSESCF